MGTRYKADVEGAIERYPGIRATPEELVEKMEANPDIAFRILYDMADTVKAAEERRLGQHRTGRRVKVKMSKDRIVREALGPPPSMDPFPVAITELMNGRSQDTFAKLMGISQGQLSRLISGKKQADRDVLELAAAAGSVPPWYFREWRSMFVGEWISAMLEVHPNISMTLMRQLPKPEIKRVL